MRKANRRVFSKKKGLVTMKGGAAEKVILQIALQMLTDKLLINYYFHMLLLQVKICNLFKGG